VATFTSNNYQGRYLQLSVVESSVDAAANTSTLTWTLTSTGGESNYYTIDATTITINGTTVYSKARTEWDSYEFPAKKGSTSGTLVVPHNSNGSKTVTVVFSTRVYIYGSIDYGGTMDLTSIDRTAPTVTFSVSDITANSFKITASSSATADEWSYSLDDGITGNDFSTTAGTSASTTVTGLTPNTTYYVRVSVRKKSNHVYGESSTTTVKTLGGSVLNSVNTVTADAASVSIVLNATVYDASYKHALNLTYGGTIHLSITGISGWAKGTANRTITLTAAQRTTLLSTMASIKSFDMTFELKTYSGTTQIGSASTKTATVQTTEANSGPTMGAFSFCDSRSTTVAVTGNNQYFIQGYSYLQVTPATATAKNEATIVKYAATCNGVTVSNTDGAALSLGAITKSGSLDVVVTATDSRGYPVSYTQKITVLAYAKPKITELSLRRTNDIEAEMQLIFNGSFSSIKPSTTEENSLLYVRYRYKLTSETSYGSYTSILASTTTSGTSFNFSNLELCSLDANSSYDFHLQIRDQLNSLSSLDLYYVIPQGTPLVALRKKMVGINTPCPDSALHVIGDEHIEGNVRIEGTLTPDNIDYDFGNPPFYYGTCATAAATVAKVVTCSGFVLETGATVAVKFTYTNTGASPTLNVNGTGAKAIKQYGSTAANTYHWRAGEVVLFVYNGSYWELISKSTATTTYYGLTKLSSSTSSTSTVLAATASAVKAAYDRNSWDSITLTNALDLAYGGTGATTAADARSNLGVAVTQLYSGSLTSGSTTFNYGSYNFYVIIAKPKSTAGIISLTVPKAQLTTTATKYQVADETNYLAFNLSYSGSTVTLAYVGTSASGSVMKVYGVN